MTLENEFLILIPNNGDYEVKVKFKKFPGSVASRKMIAEDFLKLISPIDGKFLTHMKFDDWGFEVYKYEIDPINMLVTIYAR